MSEFARLAKKYRTPAQVQAFIRTCKYNDESRGETLRSATGALARRTMHCLEAAFVAAAILEHRGFPPLVMNIDSQDNLCHTVFVYKTPQGWGSIGRSRDEGLHGRQPIFRTPRALARSYIDPFIDHTGRITGFALANLDSIKGDWRFARRNVWRIEKHLVEMPHQKLNCSNAHYAKLLERYRRGFQPVRQTYWR